MEFLSRDDLRPRVLAALTPVWIQAVFLFGMVIALATGWFLLGIGVSVSCVVGVLVGGRRFTQSEEMPAIIRTSMYVTAASALVGWSWQYFAALTTTTQPQFFPAFSPPHTVTAMKYAFTYPCRIVALVFAICCAAAVLAAWRGGARLSLLLLLLWWGGLFFLFALPTIAAHAIAAAGPGAF